MARSNDLEVNGRLTVPASELTWRFGPSGGPGGQHANTSNTRAELVFEIATSPTLTAHQRRLLDETFGPRIRVVVDDARSQTRNREVAMERLAAKMREALRPRPTRRATKPSRRAKQRRLDAKRRQGKRKAERRNRDFD